MANEGNAEVGVDTGFTVSVPMETRGPTRVSLKFVSGDQARFLVAWLPTPDAGLLEFWASFKGVGFPPQHITWRQTDVTLIQDALGLRPTMTAGEIEKLLCEQLIFLVQEPE